MTGPEVAARLLLVVAVAVLAARVCGTVAVRLRQPRVVGEVFAGIIVGPSVLGAVLPDVTAYLFPAELRPGLTAVAQLGLVLFMFLVGVELDPALLRGQRRTVAFVEVGSLVVPFLGGALVALWLSPRFGTGTDRWSFVLFMGAAMAITAFPVLVRIIQDSGLAGTPVAAVAVAAAALDDVTAWCLLAVAVAVSAATDLGEVLVTAVLTLGFVAVMVLVVRPLLARYRVVPLPVAVAVGLLAAWATEVAGVHAVFGAFVAGAVMPVTGRSRAQLEDQLRTVTTSVLLPVFFVVTGLSVRIDRLDTLYVWGVAGLVLAVAVVGKMVGATGGALLAGTGRREALTLGVLMNTRGLTEIVILSVGLELGVIDETLFSIGVVMALATTLMASPLLRRLRDPASSPLPG